MDEYTSTWPTRDLSEAQKLIASIDTILTNAVTEWTAGSLMRPPIELVVQQIVDEIVDQRYVIFHHKQTTSRDNNHWGIG